MDHHDAAVIVQMNYKMLHVKMDFGVITIVVVSERNLMIMLKLLTMINLHCGFIAKLMATRRFNYCRT